MNNIFDVRANPNSTIESQYLKVTLDTEAHLFYALGEGHALFTTKIEAGAVVTVGERIPVSCMFQMHWLVLNNAKVGFYFESQFHVVNSGGFLATYMNRGVGKASTVEVLLKTPDLVVYHYTNRGTIAVCPVIGDDVKTVFEEQ